MCTLYSVRAAATRGGSTLRARPAAACFFLFLYYNKTKLTRVRAISRANITQLYNK